MITDELTFSVIVNTTDRAGPLQTLLRALEQQSHAYFEVIVVVGPTHDNTLEILAGYGARVRVLRCPTANLSRSRNIGLLAARGDVVVYIDDDAVPCHHWLAQLARLFADPHLAGTGGAVYMIYPQRPLTQFRLGLTSSLLEQHDVRSSLVTHLTESTPATHWVARVMGTNMAFRRSALLAIGGFDEFYNYVAEEVDLVFRLVNAGYLLYPVKEAPIYHVPASSRNRQVFTHKARWWLNTRSGIYFALKLGRAAGETWRVLARRCLQLMLGHWDWFGQLQRAGHFTRWEQWRFSLAELWAGWSGIVHGVWLKRQLIPPAALSAAPSSGTPVQAFQTPTSVMQPTPDPINGRQGSLSMPDPPLRLCLLSNGYPPTQFDGVGRLTNLMARGLFERGHTVHVITRGDSEQITFYDGAYVHRTPYALERYETYRAYPGLYHSLNYSHAIYNKVKRLILNDGIQLVDSPLWQFEGLVTLASGQVPVVVRLVTSLRQMIAITGNRERDLALMADLEEMLLARAAHLLPNTQATWNTICRYYQFDTASKRHSFVPYGIEPAPETAMRPFDVEHPPATLTVLYVGRLEKRKGILDLFQAIPRVAQALPHVKFILAGADNSQHDGFRNETGLDYPTYFAQHYAHGGDRVQFLGMVSDETLQQLYQTCDVFVAPSLFESFGLIYLEAMNYAKPVVGCRSGGVPEVVEHGVTGTLVEPEASAALAEALLALLKSPRQMRDMGLAGRQRLLSKFTYLQMAQAYETAYRAVIRTFATESPPDIGGSI